MAADEKNQHEVEKGPKSLAESEVTPEVKIPATTPSDVSSPPDGGVKAWMQVLAAWILMFNTFGLINTFGVYQTYYETGQLFQSTSSNISWIGAIQSYLILFTGSLTGPIFDAGHLRILLIAGCFLIVFGHMMLSLCHEYYQVLLAQGFAIGIGSGLLFVPSVAIIPGYFAKRVGLAIGLAVSGSSIGGIIYPIALFKLIDQVGFGWSVRILGFISLAMLMFPITVMTLRVKPKAARALLDLSAFRDPQWLFFVFSIFLGMTALYAVLFYLSYYAAAVEITSLEWAFYLVPLLNVGSMIGRTVPTYLSDRYGPLNVMIPCVVVVGVLTFCLIVTKSFGAIITIAILYGVFSGVFIAMPPVVFVRITKDKTRIGTRIGMGYALLGLGSLVGGPGGGGVLGSASAGTPLNWTGLWVYGGVFAMLCAMGLIAFRINITGFKLLVKT